MCFILTVILRVIVEYAINMRVLRIEGVEISDSATSGGNLWRTASESWALRRRRSSHSSVIFSSITIIACKVECFLTNVYSEISAIIRHTCGSRRHRWHLSVTASIIFIITLNSHLRVNQSEPNCSPNLVELSLWALITLLVYWLFEPRLVVCWLWSTTVRFPFTSLKFPPRIVIFEDPPKKDPMIRKFKKL